MIGVAVDPGLNGLGVSVWDYQGNGQATLQFALYTSSTGGQPHRCFEVVPDFLELIKSLGHVDLLLIEIPQVYQERNTDPNDLINLAFCAGGMAYSATPYVRSILTVWPHDWKGNTPKMSKDGKTIVMEHRMRAKLSPEELSTVMLPKAKSLHHNVWDGVALGAWRWRQ